MAAISGSLRSLLMGVSQQPEETRFEDQAEKQINMVSDVIRGLSKRSSSEVKFHYPKTMNIDGQHFHYPDGDTFYTIHVKSDGSVKAFMEDGTEMTIYGNEQPYLASTEPTRDIKLSMVDDMVLLTNTTKVTAMETQFSSGQLYSSLQFRGGKWGAVLAVELLNTTTGAKKQFTEVMPSGTGILVDSSGNPLSPPDPNLDASLMSPVALTNSMKAKFDAWDSTATVPSTAENHIYFAPHIRIISASDGNRGALMSDVFVSVRSVNLLPPTAIDGRVVKISPDNSNESSEYYLKYEAPLNADTDSGVWRESAKVGIPFRIDAGTMPVGMIRLFDDSGVPFFIISKLNGVSVTAPNTTDPYVFPAWGDRLVGDDNSNPLPAFIGSTIKDTAVFNGRLLLLSDFNVNLSSSDNYWDFWFKTARQVLPDDTIELNVASGSTKLSHLVKQGGDLLLFGERTQFLLTGEDILTPNSTSVINTSAYDFEPRSTVAAYGQYLFFASTNGDYAGVKEMQTGAFNGTKEATSVTEHVSRFIEGIPNHLSATTEHDTLYVSTRDKVTGKPTNKMFVYQMAWEGNKKAQASWSYWTYPNNFTVEYHFIFQGNLYVILGNETLSIKTLVVHQLDDSVDTTIGHNLHLDMFETLTVNTAPSGQNVVMIPRSFPNQIMLNQNGKLLGTVDPNATDGAVAFITVTNLTDLTPKVYVGIPFKTEYSPTTPLPRDSEKKTVDTVSFMTIHRFRVYCKDFGKASFTVTGEHIPSRTFEVEGDAKGIDGTSISHKSNLGSSVVSVPILGNRSGLTMTVESEDHKPMQIMLIEWEGQIHKRKQGGF